MIIARDRYVVLSMRLELAGVSMVMKAISTIVDEFVRESLTALKRANRETPYEPRSAKSPDGQPLARGTTAGQLNLPA